MMEDAGHVIAQGRKGRAITSSGERVLQEWNAKLVRDKTRMALDQSLRIKNPDELLDVMVARRAIEAETAALAAERATAEEVQSLRDIIEEQQDVVDTGSSATQQNTDFHLTVAHAAKNRVLIAALDLIYGHPDVMKALEYVRVRVGAEMVADHRRIIQEISRQRPSAARNAMVKHMNNVIDDLSSYLRDWGEQEEQADVSKREDPGRV
jgi:GntR family L-lactate dehydrogenase operon transcriptional regulator